MYIEYFRSLPINDTPEIFGLHENANITFAQNDTHSLLESILLLQPKSSTGDVLLVKTKMILVLISNTYT